MTDCATIDTHGNELRPVIEMRVERQTHHRQFCVERMGCFDTLKGTCRVIRTPQYDDDTTMSWTVQDD